MTVFDVPPLILKHHFDELEDGIKAPNYWLYVKLARKLQHSLNRLQKLSIEEYCERFEIKITNREVENWSMRDNWYQGQLKLGFPAGFGRMYQPLIRHLDPKPAVHVTGAHSGVMITQGHFECSR